MPSEEIERVFSISSEGAQLFFDSGSTEWAVVAPRVKDRDGQTPAVFVSVLADWNLLIMI